MTHGLMKMHPWLQKYLPFRKYPPKPKQTTMIPNPI